MVKDYLFARFPHHVKEVLNSFKAPHITSCGSVVQCCHQQHYTTLSQLLVQGAWNELIHLSRAVAHLEWVNPLVHVATGTVNSACDYQKIGLFESGWTIKYERWNSQNKCIRDCDE